MRWGNVCHLQKNKTSKRSRGDLCPEREPHGNPVDMVKLGMKPTKTSRTWMTLGKNRDLGLKQMCEQEEESDVDLISYELEKVALREDDSVDIEPPH